MTQKELDKLHKRIDRISKRLTYLENKYYHWQHYFEIKKKRVEDRLSDRRKLENGIVYIRRLLKNLSIEQVRGTGTSEDKDFHILRLSSNDIRRLRLLLGSKNFMERKTRKRDGALMDFTRNEKQRLRRLLKKDWRSSIQGENVR